MKHTVDIYAKCPYYNWDDKTRICCEGMPGSLSSHAVFESPSAMSAYKRRYCKGCWSDCPFAKMQNRLYGYHPPIFHSRKEVRYSTSSLVNDSL